MGIVRFIANFAITTAVVFGLNYLNWIHVYPRTMTGTLFQDILIACIVTAGIYTVISTIISYLSALVLGGVVFWRTISWMQSFFDGPNSFRANPPVLELAGCWFLIISSFILMPVVGYMVLLIIAGIAPDFLKVTENFWLGILSGFALATLQVPKAKVTKNTPPEPPTHFYDFPEPPHNIYY
jgi:hypothetical protein